MKVGARANASGLNQQQSFILTRLRDYWALSKPRVTLLVWGTTGLGMLLASFITSTPIPGVLAFHTLIGSWFVIASANSLNQVLEVEYDAEMMRTANRPLPSGRLHLREGMFVGLMWGVFGITQLAVFVNFVVALLGTVSIILYVLAYTPLKRYSHFCTVVGAIPGAIPPLAGWVALRGIIEPPAMFLFAIQFFWQFPHFWAIAWLNRDEYALVGFRMLPSPNADGRTTAIRSLAYALLLLPLCLAFAIYMKQSVFYMLGAIVLVLWQALTAARFVGEPSSQRARSLLKSSILFLPLLLLLMLLAS
jgi:protoheme IX farnesyltransferase